MAPAHLDTLPAPVLQNIALLTVTPSAVYSPPSGVRALLCTNRSIREALCLGQYPELYACVYRAQFDPPRVGVGDAPRNPPCSTALAKELVHRWAMLRRVCNRDYVDAQTLSNDLATMFFMMEDNAGLNRCQLIAAGITTYLIEVLRHRARHSGDSSQVFAWPLADEVNALTLWLLCRTFTSEYFHNQSEGLCEELLTLVRPFVIGTWMYTSASMSLSSVAALPEIEWSSAGDPRLTFNLKEVRCCKRYFNQEVQLSCPSPAYAAILLYFALKGRMGARAPTHALPTRPEERIIPGPTVADAEAFRASYASPESALKSSTEWYTSSSDLYHRFIVGLTGTWNGSILVAPPKAQVESAPSQIIPDFICRRAFNCVLNVHVSYEFSDLSNHLGRHLEDISWSPTDDSAFHVTEDQNGVEVRMRGDTQAIRYDKLHPNDPLSSISDPTDILITGQTDAIYGMAWGAYRFIGRIRLSDGVVIIKREPMEQNDEASPSGVWIFEGCLHEESTLAGRWYPAADTSYEHGGVFTAHRVDSSTV